MSDDHVRWREVLQREWLAPLLVLLGGILVHSMNVMLVATVLPSIVDDVGGARLLAWPMTSFMAASILAATSAGMIAARMGARGGYLIGAGLFCVGSVVCAVAPSMIEIIAGRFVQGFGGGLLAGLAYVLVRKTFPERLWPRVFAMLASVWSIAVLLGPLIGGIFANAGNWRAAFWTVALIAVALGTVTFIALPRIKPDREARAPFPVRRLGLVCIGIALLSLASLGESVAVRVALLLAALGTLVLMMRIDRRSAHRILPIDAFSVRTVTGAGLWIALLMSLIFTQMPTFMPLFLQYLHDADPLTAGYMVAAASLTWTTVAVSVSGLTGHWTGRLIVIGPVLLILGLIGLAMLTPGEEMLAVLPAIMLMGAAMGSCWAFVSQRIMSGARSGDGDLAASSIAMVQQGGLAIGAALAGLVANAAGLGGEDVAGSVSRAALWVPATFIPLAFVALVLAVRLQSLSTGPVGGRS